MSDRILPVQFRAYSGKPQEHSAKPRLPINQVLIIDTETTTDTQQLNFGWARLRTVQQRDDGSIAEFWEETPSGGKIVYPAVFTVQEICFYADDLPERRPETFGALKHYCDTHSAALDGGPHIEGEFHEYPTHEDRKQGRLDILPMQEIQFIPASEFVEVYLLGSGYSDVKGREYQPATIVGFNVSFDIWRFVTRVFPARDWYYGGLAGEFLNGKPWTPNYREMRAGIGMKRELTRKTTSGVRLRFDPAYIVDLAELVRSLTGRPHSLLSAGKAFGCVTIKYDGEEIHDPEVNYQGDDLAGYLQHYIAYGRNDVAATAELWFKVMRQFLKHPINLRPNLAYSPASLSKQYLRDMGVHAPLCGCKRCLSVKRGGHRISGEVLGRCMTAFFGGRSEARVRMLSVPGVLCDWTSMYPTVMILMGIWEMLTANRIECREETAEIRLFLETVTEDDLYRPETWPLMAGIADIIPSGELIPVRAPYAVTNQSATGIGVNHVTSDQPTPVTLLDLVASKLRTGKVPRIVNGWRFYPSNDKQSTIKRIKFYGEDGLTFDPKRDNLLKFLVEQRQKAKTQHKANHDSGSVLPADGYDRCPFHWRLLMISKLEENEDRLCEKLNRPRRPIEWRWDQKQTERECQEFHQFDQPGRQVWSPDRDKCLCPDCEIERFLKVLANAIYGVFAEMNRNLKATPVKGTAFGLNGESWEIQDPEQPGEFCFPPFACLITGAARLMLAMLENRVADHGSSLMFCDTDSGCIPATATGNHDGPIPVLSYDQVNTIRERFGSLNPYDSAIVPELVKWEYPQDDRPVYVSVISAKRYVLYRLADGKPEILRVADDTDDSRSEDSAESRIIRSGTIEVVKRSEHGLGLYMSPLPSKSRWYTEAWDYIIQKHVLDLNIPEPSWFNLPAMSQFPVRTLHVWQALAGFNEDLPMNRQIRPFNFYLAIHPSAVEQMFNPKLRLIAPFSSDPATWLTPAYIDLHTKRKYRVTTDPDSAVPGKVILVKTYREVIHEYVNHPEFKYDDSDGNPCGPKTKGILQPAHVLAESFQHITKDSSSLNRTGDVFEYHGPTVLRDNSRQVMEARMRELLEFHGYTRRKLSAEVGISEKEARGFLSDTVQVMRDAAWHKLLTFTVNLAKNDLREFDRLWSSLRTPGQILAAWERMWNE